MHISKVSLFMVPLRFTIVTFFMFCIIFMGLYLVACSFLALALYSFMHILMLLGLLIHLIVDLFLLIVFFLVWFSHCLED